MNRIFKTLLIWLLVIALPVQVTAAVIKSSCGTDHHAMTTQHLAPEPARTFDHHHGAHGAAHSVQPEHASAQADLADAALSTTDAIPADKPVKHDGHSTCSACAACCIGAVAPPSAHVKTPHFTDFTTRTVLSSKFLSGFIPAGLERPPRDFLA